MNGPRSGAYRVLVGVPLCYSRGNTVYLDIGESVTRSTRGFWNEWTILARRQCLRTGLRNRSRYILTSLAAFAHTSSSPLSSVTFHFDSLLQNLA
jgi:hypothetical protein